MGSDETVRARLLDIGGDAPGIDDELAAAKRRGFAQRRRRERTRAGAGVCLVMLLLLVGGFRLRPSNTPANVISGGDAEASWQMVPSLPGGSRGVPQGLWTGSEVLVWGASVGTGGDATLAPGGYAFNPATKQWRTIPEPAIDRVQLVSQVAWTGSKVLMIACPLGVPQQGARALAYDPATNEWTRLPDPPFTNACGGKGVWSGSDLLVWQNHEGAAYNPVSNEWRTIPAPPLAVDEATLMGAKVMATGTEPVPDGLNRVRPTASVYDIAASTWTTVPAPPVWGPAVWTGDRLLVAGTSSTTLFTFDPRTNLWAQTADIPLEPRDGASVAFVNGRFVVWGGTGAQRERPGNTRSLDAEPSRDLLYNDGAIYDVGRASWSVVPPSPLPGRSRASAVAVGHDVLIVGGHDACVRYLTDGAILNSDRVPTDHPGGNTPGLGPTTRATCSSSGTSAVPGTVVEIGR